MKYCSSLATVMCCTGDFVRAFNFACEYHGIQPSYAGLEEIILRYDKHRQREFVADDFHLLQDE